MIGYIVGDKYTNMTIVGNDNIKQSTTIKYTNNKYDASRKSKKKNVGNTPDGNTSIAQDISNALRKKS